ncbi:uncharacterized protein ACIB01_013711 isoform 1-T1 [Guaruba guarouba]
MFSRLDIATDQIGAEEILSQTSEMGKAEPNQEDDDHLFDRIAGVNPRKGVWKKWNVESLEAATVNYTSKDATAKIQASASASSTATNGRLEVNSAANKLEQGHFQASVERTPVSLSVLPLKSMTLPDKLKLQ